MQAVRRTLDNLKIGGKLWLAYGILGAVAVVVTLSSLVAQFLVDQQISRTTEVSAIIDRLTDQIERKIGDSQLALQNIILQRAVAGVPDEMLPQDALDSLASIHADVAELRVVVSADDEIHLEQIRVTLSDFEDQLDVLELRVETLLGELETLGDEESGKQLELLESLETLGEHTEQTGLITVHLASLDAVSEARAFLVDGDPEHIGGFHNDLAELRATIGSSPALSQQDRAELIALIDTAIENFDEVVLLQLAFDTRYRAFVDQSGDLQARVDLMREIGQEHYNESVVGINNAQQVSLTMRRLMLAVLLILLPATANLAIQIGYSITSPLAELVNTTQELSAGNLAARVEIDQQDEVGSLARHFNEMADALEASIKEARRARTLAEALADTAATLTATLDSDEVLDRVLTNIGNVVPHDAAMIMLLADDVAQVVRSRGFAERGLELALMAIHFRLGDFPDMAKVVQSREPLIVADTQKDEDWVVTPAGEWIRSGITVPMRTRAGVLGLIRLDSAMPDFFTEAHVQGLQALADQAALAIRNAQLFEAERERHQVAETLRQAALTLSSTLDLEAVLDLILQHLKGVITFDTGTVQRMEDGDLVVLSSIGFDRESIVGDLVFPISSKFPNFRVVAEQKPLAIPDVAEAYPHFQDEATTFESGHIRSWMGVPLMAKDTFIGMLTLDRTTVNPFTEGEIELATAIASHAATAIENARLYDITRQHSEELEQRIAESTAELSAANAELFALAAVKDEFVSNVTHELRTPIANIKLYLELLRLNPPKREEYMETLNRETNRLEFLVEDLLYLSRLDQRVTATELKQIDMNALVNIFIADRSPLAEKRQIALHFTETAGLPNVLADEMQIGQVVSGLLTNALNYTPAGGEVTVRTAQEAREGAMCVKVIVSDNGPGITPDEQARIFERFFRGQAGLDTGNPGTGLGLAIAREIVERFGGQIEVASSGVSGEGATFTLCLPVSPSREGQPSGDQARSEAHGS